MLSQRQAHERAVQVLLRAVGQWGSLGIGPGRGWGAACPGTLLGSKALQHMKRSQQAECGRTPHQ